MNADDARTLDIKEPQILRHYPHDAGGYYWHHRVLLEKCSPGIWIGLTPDGDLERIDLSVTPHIVVERRRPFPPAQAADVYAFDEMSRAELEGFRRRAKVMNGLFNDEAFEGVDSYEWLVADLSRADFGSIIDDDLVDDGVVMRDSAIVDKDGEEVFVQRVATSSKATWLSDRDRTKGDIRILGDFRDGQGRRFLSFKDAVDKLRTSEITDWALAGPRSVAEFMRAVRDGSSDLTTYHLNWAQHSGISSYGAAVHEHRVLCDSLRCMLSVDQIDISNSLGAEILVRRIVQIETATARNPASPDYSGLEVLMEQPLGAGGEAQVIKLSEWVGARLKERATIQKQSRLYKEEFAKRQGGKGDAEGQPGRGRGRGRAGKGKAKAAAASGAAAIKSKVGLFFVKKKDPNYIRMVVDARIPNFHHRAPPITRLGSGVNFGELDLSQDSINHFLPDLSNDDVGFGNELDVADAFYQFKVPQMAQWFGMDYPKTVGYWRSRGIVLSKGIPVNWTYPEPMRRFETVGIIVDFENKKVFNKPLRLWKVYLASRALLRRGRVRGEMVEVWLGHVTALFRLAPHFLSIFSHIYRFCEIARGRRVWFWPSVKAEIRLASDLVWLAYSELGGPYIRQLDMGDSADFGYALMTRHTLLSDLRELCSVKEKWRFISLPEDVKSGMEAAREAVDSGRSVDVETLSSFVRSGVGISTEYGQWLQQALQEGSWLKTSAIVSQYKAKKRKRFDVEMPALVKPVSNHLVDPSSYKLLWARKWKNPSEHINLKEARVLLSSLKRSCRVASLFGHRKVSLSDNLVSVLSFEKGRSSSGGINKLCRRAAGFIGATGVKWRIRHVETKRNVADEPSRWFEKGSRIWEFPLFDPVYSLPGVHVIDLDMCMYGTPYQKSTRILTNSSVFDTLGRRCIHRRHDEVLKGKTRVVDAVGSRWVNRTQLAGEYPFQLVKAWASCLKTIPTSQHDPEEFRTVASGVQDKISEAFSRKSSGEEQHQPSSRKRTKRSLNVPVAVPASRALRVAKISSRTQNLYLQAVSRFEEWAKAQRRRLTSHRQTDEVMSCYLQHLCTDGASITEGSYVVFGWILFRSQEHMDSKFQLPFARMALKGWRSRFPPKSRTGIDMSIWDVVALHCVQQGDWLTACGILIQGDAYLRPSELFSLTKQHLVPPSASRTKAIWGVIIGLLELGKPTKAGEYDDVVLFDTPGRSDINMIISSLSKRKISDSDSLLSPLGQVQYGRNIQVALQQLGLKHLGLSPHSLRHSGASSDSFNAVRDAKDIQTRGRWKCSDSVKRYKKPGRMMLNQKKVPQAVWSRAKHARAEAIPAILKLIK
eukprot:Skav204591  [mRNA]  locus=scaffold672:132020:137458:- [translate_table: standard]